VGFGQACRKSNTADTDILQYGELGRGGRKNRPERAPRKKEKIEVTLDELRRQKKHLLRDKKKRMERRPHKKGKGETVMGN